MSDKKIYDLDVSGLAGEMVGRSIKAIAGNTIELSDGTTLEVESAGDCCAWFTGDVKAFDFANNVITGVTHVDRDPTDDVPERWSLQVYSGHKLIAKVNIEGDSTSGYYGHSVSMTVKASIR